MNRETCYTALFALLLALKQQGTVRTCERRLRFLEEMGASELPALFLAVDHGDVLPQPGMGPKRVLGAKIFVYAANPDRHTPASIALNGLIDAVEGTLSPPAGAEYQTLSGNVRHAWIEGAVQIFEGPAGERAAAILPVRMLVP